MKTNKLNLKNLKVTSFVTSEKNQVTGGLAQIDEIDTNPITPTCKPTPMTWCYICPQDIPGF